MLNIFVVLRNLYENPDPFDDEMLVGDSDVNIISEACQLRDELMQGGEAACVTALLFSESKSDSIQVLKKAASYGADKVYHAEVDGFDFTDANIFSKVIAQVVSKFPSWGQSDLDSSEDQTKSPGSDDLAKDMLLMFGRLAYDGDSVNIATQTAERLGWNKAIYSKRCALISSPGKTNSPSGVASSFDLKFTKSLDGGKTLEASTPLPAVVHSIRKEDLRRQAKVQDILRAYGEFEVGKIPPDIVSMAINDAMSGHALGRGKQEIPPYAEAKEMINLNGISDVDTSRNIIRVLKQLGFEAHNDAQNKQHNEAHK